MLLKQIVFVYFLLLSGLVQAQNPVLNQAHREFELLNYTKAITLFEDLLKTNTLLATDQKQQILQKMGIAYRELKQYPKAEKVYQDLLASNPNLLGEDARTYLYYAQVLASNSKFKEADAMFEKYKQTGLGNIRNIATAKILSEATLAKNTENYNIEYLNINTAGPEFSPIYYKNGLVFVGSGKSHFLDLFYLDNLKGLRSGNDKRQQREIAVTNFLGTDAYTTPTSNDSKTLGNFGGNATIQGLGYGERPMSESDRFSKTLNTKYHEGPATFSKDGSRIIFTRNNYNEGEYRKSSDGVNKLKLYTADLLNGAWQNTRELPFNSDEYSSGHPTLTKDDKILYFVSDRPGGLGATDIYMARFESGVWQEPIHLGKDLNSKGDEMFPFVDDKGNLYFSSNGRGGMGELDIFFVPINPQTGFPIGKPQNIGSPINSSGDDFGIITDIERKEGFFCSNRKTGNDDDIYRFTRTKSLFDCRELIVSVYDEETKKTLANATITYEVGEGKNAKIEKAKANENGILKLCLEDNSYFVFSAQQDSYVSSKIGFSTKSSGADAPSRLDISLKRVLKVTTPSNVVYESNPNPSISIFRGVINAGEENRPIEGVLVTLTNECDGIVQQVKTGIDGVYEFQREEGCDYIIEASKENYGKNVERIVKTVERKISPSSEPKFKIGSVVLVDNIFYDAGSWYLRKEAKRELNKLASTLKKNGSMVIELRSHTDSRGSAEKNRILSQKMAQAAADYLVDRGVSKDKVIAKGYGESEPINECVDGVQCTEAEYQRNRRTEFKILSINQ